jgi:hypothetical protein
MCSSKHGGHTKTPTPGNVQHVAQVTCCGSLSQAQYQTLSYNTKAQHMLGFSSEVQNKAYDCYVFYALSKQTA